MVDRSRKTLINILCGSMTDMRPATEAEQEQYRKNTDTTFDLLAVGKNAGVAEAHIACSALAGSFAFDRIKRYEKPWYEMAGKDLVGGTTLSELYPGRSVSDPFVAKAVALMRENIPNYAGKLTMHGTEFPAMVLDMAADYVDRATYYDGTLNLESARELHSFIQSMGVAATPGNQGLDSLLLSSQEFQAKRAGFSSELETFERETINQLVEEIDLSSVPLPGR